MHEYVGLIEKMPLATLHGVRVNTKLYFVIIAAFKESVTLNLAQRSFKVIHVGGNRKTVYDFIWVVNSKFQQFRRYCQFYTPRANCVSK